MHSLKKKKKIPTPESLLQKARRSLRGKPKSERGKESEGEREREKEMRREGEK